jgi:hypothetical protein
MVEQDRFDLCGLDRLVHLSIDDVGASLRWLFQNGPQSVWDMRFFGKLRELREKYHAEFTLYCFYDFGGGLTFNDMPDNYAKEFSLCADWLKFGFHSRNGEPFLSDADWMPAFVSVYSAIRRYGIGETDVLRLHYWKASQEQKHRLRDMGVMTLLYPNEERYYQYDRYSEAGIVHRRTRVCFEKISELNECALAVGVSVVVAFTHERFFEQQSVNMEFALRSYSENGYSFFS